MRGEGWGKGGEVMLKREAQAYEKRGYAFDTQAGTMIKSQIGACTQRPHSKLEKSGETRDTM